MSQTEVNLKGAGPQTHHHISLIVLLGKTCCIKNVSVVFVAAVAMRPCTLPALSCEPVNNTNSLHCQDEFPGEAGTSAAHLADRRERGGGRRWEIAPAAQT